MHQISWMIPFTEKKSYLKKRKSQLWTFFFFFYCKKAKTFFFKWHRTSPPHLCSLAPTCLHVITVKFWFWSLPSVGESTFKGKKFLQAGSFTGTCTEVSSFKRRVISVTPASCIVRWNVHVAGDVQVLWLLFIVCFWFTLTDSIPWNDTGQQNCSSQIDVLFVLNLLITFSLTVSHQYIGLAVSEHYFVS